MQNVRANDSPPPYSQDVISRLHASSNQFYEDHVRGKKLGKLKPLADGMRDRIYQSLGYFLEKRLEGRSIEVIDLSNALEAIRNLKLIYTEMELQERRWFIKTVRILGSDRAVTAMLMVTILCGAYTLIAFGIAPDLDSQAGEEGVVVSAIAVAVIAAVLTIFLEYLKRKYAKVGISKKDLEERAFFSTYFRHFGKLEFEECIKLVENLSWTLKITIPYDKQEGLIKIAKECANANFPLMRDYERQFPHDDSVKPRRSLHARLQPWIDRLHPMGAHYDENLGSNKLTKISIQDLLDLNLSLDQIQEPEGGSNMPSVADPFSLPETQTPSQIFDPFDFAHSDDEGEAAAAIPIHDSEPPI